MSERKPHPGVMYRITREDVISAYQRLLGRPPDDEGMIEYRMKWCSAADLIESITDSAEYAARLRGPKTTRAEVIALYHAFLGRPPENESIIEMRMATCSSAELISSLMESPEYVPNRQAGLSRADVVALYDIVLGRPPENETVIAAQMKLTSAADLIAELRQSAEYIRWNKASRLTRKDVTAIYQLVLERAPENESVIEAQIKVGSAAALIAELTSSEEFVRWNKASRLTRKDVGAIYQLVLERPPESERVIDAQVKVRSAAALIAELTSSTEYAERRKTLALTRADVVAIYRLVLGRPPENEKVIAAQIKVGSAASLIAELTSSEEYAELRKTLGLTREDVIAIYQTVLGRPPENESVLAAQIKVGSAAALISELAESEELKVRKRSGLTRDDVMKAYRALLGREPEDETIRIELESPSAGALVESIVRSQEYVIRKKDTAYLYYTAVFDPIAVILKHEFPGRRPKPGHLVNFLGVAMNLAFAPRLFEGHPGGLESVPIPANWHADMAEFGAVLRAVNLARDNFTMIELGCGWGCWMINSGVAARRAGLRVKLIGAEADEGHLAFAAEALATNGFRPKDYVLHRCIAAPETGSALFPKQQVTGQNWALEPILAPTEAERTDALASGLYEEVATQSLQSVIGRNRRIDLLHIDIQGGERDLVRRSIAVLTERVAYLVVGTHSRSIEGELIEELSAAGWLPEIERPAIMGINDGQARVSTDGVQGWRNPRLLPLEEAHRPTHSPVRGEAV